jgi:hypothetical protein
MANWIAGAVGKNKGRFSAKAKKAGLSTSAFEDKVLKKGSKADTTTRREASLAKTLGGLRKGK